MELEKYISSGILERYVLGDTSSEENQELEGYVKLYPELKTELETLQDAIEAYAKAHAITPPAELKEKIMAAIDAIEAGTYTSSTEGETREETQESETKVIPMRKPDVFRWVAAASIILLIISAAYNFKQYNDLKDTENQLAALKATNDIMANETDLFKARLQESDNLLAAISSPDNKIVTMAGIPEKAPTAQANIYYNQKTKEAYMTIGSLPTPPSDKQYQLWGVELGPNGELQPTSMGVFDLESGILKMENMPGNPALFAVTLEPKGGSEGPTLEEMYVMGKI